MKEQIEKLNQVAHSIAQTIYAQTEQKGPEGPEGSSDEGDKGDGDKGGKADEDVVDAEFEDIGKK